MQDIGLQKCVQNKPGMNTQKIQVNRREREQPSNCNILQPLKPASKQATGDKASQQKGIKTIKQNGTRYVTNRLPRKKENGYYAQN